ncbi:MAG TPA: DUF1015 family protein [bacterium]|jgi:uncharacterized protein (DUF1015 family)|nr:DUF1015 family protein [bacterium]HOG38420.1 DUF1015 family protein [bacterium]HQI03319.1 DUF1015 family protein [bacterium]
MVIVKPFKALRPKPELVSDVACVPYDVINSEEARKLVNGNPNSFLHVTKAEVDLEQGIDTYSEEVYQKGKENFEKMIKDGIFFQEEKPVFYIYKLVMGSVTEIGIVGGASVVDYENDIIKKHEKTRVDKEEDRIKHIETCNAHTEPIFLTYCAREDMDMLVNDFIKSNEPVYDFTADDGISHTLWKIDDDEVNSKIENIFSNIDYLYIADGHHRSAAGAILGQRKREKNPNHTGNEEYNFIMSVIFPHNQLYIMDYNRIVKDLNGLSKEEFFEKVKEKFDIEEYSTTDAFKPSEQHTFGMYIDGAWYKLTAKNDSYDSSDVIGSLDVSILQNNLLYPILGIEDPRKDKRIDFVGGIRGLDELKKRVDNGEAVAFSMFPTSVEELMKIADAGETMPPKSTWFEPKLRSALFIHLLD